MGGYIRPGPNNFILCVIRDCSGAYVIRDVDTIMDCLFESNNEFIDGPVVVYNNVIDGSGGTPADDLIRATARSAVIYGNRFLNAPATFYAIDAAADFGPTIFEDYNVYYNPAAADDLRNITMGDNSVDTGDSGEVGVDANWNVEDGKDIDSVEIVLNWDAP